MLRKLCMPSLAVAVLCCAATTSWGNLLLGDFEGGDDGWAATASAILTPTTFDNSIHATRGDYALNLFAPPGGGFQWTAQLDNNDVPNLIQRFLNNGSKVYADVSWTEEEWAPSDGTWSRWDASSINSNGGWMQTNDSLMTDSSGTAGVWSLGPTNVRTISWDFSSLVAGNEQAMIDGGWMQLNLSFNFDSNFDEKAGYSFWIDNIRMVPEPGTLALLGLGSLLAMIRRRR